MEREGFERFFDDVVRSVRGGFDRVVEKTDQLTHMGRLKFDMLSLKRECDAAKLELGALVYSRRSDAASEVLASPEVVSVLEKIQDLEERLTLKQDEFEHRRRAEKAEKAADAEGGQTAGV